MEGNLSPSVELRAGEERAPRPPQGPEASRGGGLTGPAFKREFPWEDYPGLTPRVFNGFRALILEKCGIALNEKKMALLCARVGKRLRALGLRDFGKYLDRLLADGDGGEVIHLLDAISTNVTRFFREPQHFGFLETAFAGWLDSGRRRFRFWSAGCSTGEEPYSIAMTLLECGAGKPGLDVRILASDLSTAALSRAVAGEYPARRILEVPAELRERYFKRVEPGENSPFRARELLKNRILFQRINLAEAPYPLRGPLDAVFCRNVMIYFDLEGRKRLLGEMLRLLKPGGFLAVGHAESLTGMIGDFQLVQASIYRKKR